MPDTSILPNGRPLADTSMPYWKEKVVLVTGGSSGLGRMIAEQFGSAGAKVVIAALEEDDVRRAASEMEDQGVDVLGIPADITDQSQVDSLFQQTIDHFGQLDTLVNNAGRSMRGKVLDTTPEQFQSLWELNFLALVRCTRAAVPHLLPRSGHIVNIGSLAAKSSARWVGAYPATKHAVAAYSQQLRLEHGHEGLHVLLVCPGPIARDNPRLYALEGMDGIPESARAPGGGVKVGKIPPEKLTRRILTACEKRKPELVIPGKARLLFAISQLFPGLGDKIILKKTGN